MLKCDYDCYLNKNTQCVLFIRRDSTTVAWEEAHSLVLLPASEDSYEITKMMYPELASKIQVWENYKGELYLERYSVNRVHHICAWYGDFWGSVK